MSGVPDQQRVQVYGSAVDFVLEDMTRLSYLSIGGEQSAEPEQPLWSEFVQDPRAFKARGGYLALAGMDFGYKWRHDGYDLDEGRHLGTWRVPWNRRNNELYAENRKHDKVWLIGELPPDTNSTSIIHWFLDVEPRRDEPNSLGMVLDLYEAGRANGFRDLNSGRVD